MLKFRLCRSNIYIMQCYCELARITLVNVNVVLRNCVIRNVTGYFRVEVNNNYI